MSEEASEQQSSQQSAEQCSQQSAEQGGQNSAQSSSEESARDADGQAACEQNSSQQSCEQAIEDEIKIRRFNDIVFLTGWVLDILRPVSGGNVQDVLDAVNERVEILRTLKNLSEEELELFSKRVKSGLILKRILEGTQWDFVSAQTNHDFRWLFTGEPITPMQQKVTGFYDVNIYNHYKEGLDIGLQVWEENGSDPEKKPAYFPLPEPELYLNRFIQMELIAKIFYKIHPEKITQ